MSLQEKITVLKALPLPIYWEMLPIVCATHAKDGDENLINKEYKVAGYNEIELKNNTVVTFGGGLPGKITPGVIIRDKGKKPRFTMSASGFICMTYDDYVI